MLCDLPALFYPCITVLGPHGGLMRGLTFPVVFDGSSFTWQSNCSCEVKAVCKYGTVIVYLAAKDQHQSCVKVSRSLIMVTHLCARVRFIKNVKLFIFRLFPSINFHPPNPGTGPVSPRNKFSESSSLPFPGCTKPRWQRPKSRTGGFKTAVHKPTGDVMTTPSNSSLWLWFGSSG